MSLTRDFTETIQARIRRDPAFRHGPLREGIECLLSGDVEDAVHPRPSTFTRPVGAWNTARLVVRGARVEHWMNGEKLLEYELGSPDWQERMMASKFASIPRYGREPPRAHRHPGPRRLRRVPERSRSAGSTRSES